MQNVKRFLKSSNSAKQIFVIVSLLLFSNICAARLSVYIFYGSFFDQMGNFLLSNLLFVEGALAFTVGAFLCFFYTGYSRSEEEMESRKKRVKLGVLMTATGTILILLSICIGAFFI